MSREARLLLLTEVYCCRRRAKYRHLYEQWELISASITLQTGCGGGGGGFTLIDLSLQTQFFFGLSAQFPREILHPAESQAQKLKIFPKIFFFSEQRTVSTKKHNTNERAFGWYQLSSNHLWRGRLRWLERVYAPLRCVGNSDLRIGGITPQEGVGGKELVRSRRSGGLNHTGASVFARSSKPTPKTQDGGPCDATHSPVQSTAELVLRSHSADGMSAHIGGWHWLRIRLSYGRWVGRGLAYHSEQWRHQMEKPC